MFSGEKESVNAHHHLGVRPSCRCCGGSTKKQKNRFGKAIRKDRNKKSVKKKSKFTRETIRKF